MKKGLAACLLLLSACSSTTPNGRSGDAALSVGGLYPPQGADVLFARLVKQEGRWRLLAMSTSRMPVDLLKGEERLYIRTGSQYVMPDYVHFQYRDKEKKLFDCGQTVGYNKHTTYNPCVSLFSSNTRFGEGWFGWTRRFDMPEIRKAVEQTGLLQRAHQEMAQVIQERRRCEALRQQAEQVVAGQKLAVRVIDKTGLYANGHEAVSYDLKIRPDIASEGCEQDLEQVKLNYDVTIEQRLGLVLELRGKTDWRQLDQNKLALRRAIAEADSYLLPTLYITGKKINHYNLYQTWSNQDIEIVWRTLDISDTDLQQLFDIRNLSQSTIQVQRVTFYINRYAIAHRQHYQLSPQTSETDLAHASRYFLLQEKVRQPIEAIKTIDTRSEQAEFGVRLVYTINGKEKSLSKTDTVLLTSVL